MEVHENQSRCRHLSDNTEDGQCHTMESRRQPLEHRQVSRKRKKKKIVRRKVKKGRKGYYVRK